MSEQTYHPLRCSYCGAAGHTLLQCQQTKPKDWEPTPSVDLQAATAQPAPQGAVEAFDATDWGELYRLRELFKGPRWHKNASEELRKRQKTEQAIIAERDTLCARIAELEKDAARYQFWRNRWGDGQFLSTLAGTIRQLSDPLIRGDYNNLDIVSDAAIAASKEAP